MTVTSQIARPAAIPIRPFLAFTPLPTHHSSLFFLNPEKEAVCGSSACTVAAWHISSNPPCLEPRVDSRPNQDLPLGIEFSIPQCPAAAFAGVAPLGGVTGGVERSDGLASAAVVGRRHRPGYADDAWSTAASAQSSTALGSARSTDAAGEE